MTFETKSRSAIFSGIRNLALFALTVFLISGCSVMQPLQKRKIFGVFHLIETAKYNEAKILVEELVEDKDASLWPNTWYARGVLSQNAYREGIRRNDRKLTELYPNQLYVTLESFNRAQQLDRRGRMIRQLAPRYVLLANDLQTAGERHFRARQFDEALRAFESALEISQRPVLGLKADTNLIYNAGLAAYESRNWDKAMRHFRRLHQMRHSANVTHLLFKSHLQLGDTVAAQNVLNEGINRFDHDSDLVLLLSDLHLRSRDTTRAMEVLDRAIAAKPDNARFHHSLGLIKQKSGLFAEAIEAYNEAVRLAPGELMSHVNIAMSYYNIGVKIEENSRTIMNSLLVQQEKAKADEAFATALNWLDQAYAKNPADQEVLRNMHRLYVAMKVSDKARVLERRIK
jgi:tetratricopeptide (TPR) repeat protein